MEKKVLRSDLLMLLTSAIWGFAFVAQRQGMEHVGPFTYNGIRFALGSLSLVPLILILGKKRRRSAQNPEARAKRRQDRTGLIVSGLIAGTILFAGASLQQIGIVYTGAGKAGFITGLYVVLVPLSGVFLGHKTGKATWLAAFLAVCGLYFLGVQDGFSNINPGDALVALSAFFWAAHVLVIDRFCKRYDAISLSAIQFAATSIFSLLVALLLESFILADILSAALPILYGGLGSVGVAYTLQVIAQKDAPPAHAAILLSLEGVFAVIGGVLILSEPLTLRILSGCVLMLLAMLATQWEVLFAKKKTYI
ncbi:DMT family transporter [Treponema sp.]